MVVHACNPSMGKAKAKSKLKVWGQLEQYLWEKTVSGDAAQVGSTCLVYICGSRFNSQYCKDEKKIFQWGEAAANFPVPRQPAQYSLLVKPQIVSAYHLIKMTVLPPSNLQGQPPIGALPILQKC